MHRTRSLVLGIIVLVAIGVGAFVVLRGGDDKAKEHPSSTTNATSSTTELTTTLPPTTGAPGLVPGQVTVLRAGPAGGSGEIEVVWDAVSGASGYRISRATTPGGPFSVAADVNVTTGKTTAASGVTNVFSDQQTFFPPASATPVPTTSSKQFHYVEVVSTPGNPSRYYRVTAYNAAGDGRPSATVCGAPVGFSAC
jgi:hypothetical protein